MASFRTIVGGRSSGPSNALSFPRGIELLLKKAKADPDFNAVFLENPVSAARLVSLELSETEQKILASMSAASLEIAVKHTRLSEEHIGLFRSARTATALLAAFSVMVALPPQAAAAGAREEPYAMQDSKGIAVERMAAIQEVLEEYRKIHGEYPSTLQWMTDNNPLDGWLPRAGIFDPWYQRFRYEGIVSGGRIVNYRLESAGIDLVSPDDNVGCPIDPQLHSFVVPNPVVITSPRNGDTIAQNGVTQNRAILVTAKYTALDGEIVWLLDRIVIGTTTGSHRFSFSTGIGVHELVAQDRHGNSDFIVFEVVDGTAK